MSNLNLSFAPVVDFSDLQSLLLKVVIFACSIILARYIPMTLPIFTITKKEEVTTSITAGSVEVPSRHSHSNRRAGTPVEESPDSPSLHQLLSSTLPEVGAHTHATIPAREPAVYTPHCITQYGMISPMPPNTRLPSLACFEVDATHAAAYASFASDNSFSLLTEDQSSILDDTLPSILEDVGMESEGGHENYGIVGEGHDSSYIHQTSAGTQRLVGLGFKGFNFPFAPATSSYDLGLLPYSLDAEHASDKPSAQFLAQIMATFASTN